MRKDKTEPYEDRNASIKTKTTHTQDRKPEEQPPSVDTQWRPPASLNPWARAFDGDSLPDEPYMGSNKKPKQLSDMLPYPDPTSAGIEDDRPHSTLEGMR
ncbi:MAG: hypothetical protein Q3X74_02885 [Bifidobacterium sp.]|uniref:hypothetical protein n=1 Tax=Bifidobacterium sp. TaxID=41200 RepID=UPI0028403962|nr:hypothetical protein [Bifidobacterium sp.]MDR3912105.1 hypothetical protein [Bifidobacterium sp.]